MDDNTFIDPALLVAWRPPSALWFQRAYRSLSAHPETITRRSARPYSSLLPTSERVILSNPCLSSFQPPLHHRDPASRVASISPMTPSRHPCHWNGLFLMTAWSTEAVANTH